MNDHTETEGAGGREEAAAYIAELARDLARIARLHGLDTVGYILDMARLEAETISGPPRLDTNT